MKLYTKGIHAHSMLNVEASVWNCPAILRHYWIAAVNNHCPKPRHITTRAVRDHHDLARPELRTS